MDEIDGGERHVPSVGGNVKTSETASPSPCLVRLAAAVDEEEDMADIVDDVGDAERPVVVAAAVDA